MAEIGLVKSVKSHRYRPRVHSTPDFSATVTPAMCRALNGEVCEVYLPIRFIADSSALVVERHHRGSDLIMITRPDPFSSTSIEARVSLNTVGGLYRGSFPLRCRP